ELFVHRTGHGLLLVDLETQTVPRTVDEELSETGGLDDGAGRAVDVGAGRAGDGRSHRRRLGVADDAEELALSLIGLAARDKGSSDVGAVPLVRGPDVDDDEITRGDRRPVRRAVGKRRLRAGEDGRRKGRAVSALLADQSPGKVGELGLGSSG